MARVEGPKEFIARVERLRRNASNLKAPLKDSADYILGVLDQNFASGGRPPWKQLAASTRAHKSGGILEESGDMRGANEPLFFKDGWEIVNTDWKAPFHLRGTKRNGEEHIPARNWMNYQPEDVPIIGEIFFVHITQ
jgi:phage gpG-like protein